MVLVDNDLEETAAYWREMLEENPNDPVASYRLGLLLAITAPEEAGEILDRAATLDPNLETPVSQVKATLRLSNAVEDAAYHLTLMGQTLSSLEEWTLAEAALRRAVEVDPRYAEAWAYLGEALQHTGQDGLPALKTAISINPESYAANIFMGIYYRRAEQPEEALPYMQTAARQDPQNRILRQDLAYTLAEAGYIELALELLTAPTEADPEDLEAWQMLAEFSVETGIQVPEVGVWAARQAVVLAPEDAHSNLLLGRAYLHTNDAVLAERFLLESAALDDTSAEPHLYLGILYLNNDDPQAAQAHLELAAQLGAEHNAPVIAAQAEDILAQSFPVGQ